MKKFLFTLLTLFMASSAFAEGGNTLTMNDYTVVKTKLETKQVSVGVKAHFDNYVSALQVWVEVPEGVTLRGASAGNDYGISYMDNMGMDKVATPEITFKDGKFIIASMAAAYGDDGDTYYGVAKWAPGDYENYLNLVFRCNADFKGGDVKIIAAPACGDDTRPEVVANKADGTSYTTTSTLSVEYIAPEPVLTWDENNYIMTATLPEGYNADDYEIVMMANGVEVQNTYTVDQTSEDQTIEFTAYTKHAADETYDSNDATYGKQTKQTVTVPAKVVETIEKPVITFSGEETTEMTVTVSCATEGVTLYVNGEAVEGNPYSYIATRADVYTAGTVEVTAQAKKGDVLSEEVKESKDWVVQQKPEAPEATKTEVVSDTEVTVNFTPAQGTAVSVAVDGQTVQLPYVIERPAYGEQPKTVTFTVTVTGDNYTTNTYEVTVTAEPQTTPPAPVETVTYVKVTDASQLVAGKHYVLVAGDYAMGEVVANSTAPGVAVTFNGDEVEIDPAKVTVLTLGESVTAYSSTSWPVQLPNGKYLAVAGTNKFKMVDDATSSYNRWKISSTFSISDGDYGYPVKKSRINDFGPTNSNSEMTTAVLYVEKTDEPVLQDLTGKIVVSEPDANGVVTVTYTGDEDVTITVNGEPVAESYQLEDGVPMTFEVTVSAEGYKDLTAEETRTWTKPEDPALGGYFVWSALNADGQFTVEYKNYDLEGVTFTLVVTGEDGKTIEPMDGYYQAAEGTHTYTATVTATGYKDKSENHEYTYTKPNPAPVPTFNWDPDTYTMEAVCEGHTVVLMANGTEVTNPKTYTQTTEEQKINFSAYTVANDGETANSATVYYAQNPVVIPALVLEQTAKPEIVVTNDDNFYYVTVKAVEGVATLYNAEGEAYTAEELPVKLERTDETYRVLFKADAIADGKTVSEQVTEMVSVAPKVVLKQLTGKITFSVTQGNKNNPEAGIVTATYDGEETGVTVKIVGDPTKVAAATSEGVRLPDYGTYQVKAVATAEGYADLEDEGEVTWDEPQTAAPEFTVSEDGLTVEATGEGTVTLYIVNADGSETAIDNPTTFDQKDESYTVNLKAVAHVDGAKDGEATKSIVIPAKSSEPGTGVNELVDGKAVKSVRYFNMAGQEMPEVNGVTIVVTTYTDGTTSAVKVMK